jgi:predicted ferric reductase
VVSTQFESEASHRVSATRLFVVLFRFVRNFKICPLESRSLLIFPVRLPVHLYVKRATDELPNSEKARNVFAEWIVVKLVMVAKHWDSFQAENFLSTTVLH